MTDRNDVTPPATDEEITAAIVALKKSHKCQCTPCILKQVVKQREKKS